jgi:hypothetical protein
MRTRYGAAADERAREAHRRLSSGTGSEPLTTVELAPVRPACGSLLTERPLHSLQAPFGGQRQRDGLRSALGSDAEATDQGNQFVADLSGSISM